MSNYKASYQEPNLYLTFSNTAQTEINCFLKELMFATENFKLIELTFLIEVDWETYQVIDKNDIFYLADNKKVDSEQINFDIQKPIELTLKLDNNFFGLVKAETSEEFADHLKNNLLDKKFFDVQIWYALHVVQQAQLPSGLEGSLKMGYSTTWATEDAEVPISAFSQSIYDFFAMQIQTLKILETNVLAFEYQADDLIWNCKIIIREQYHQILMYSFYPFEIPISKRFSILEKISKINYDLPIGNLEMDLEDGEVRFKTYLDIGETLTQIALYNFYEANIYTAKDIFTQLSQS